MATSSGTPQQPVTTPTARFCDVTPRIAQMGLLDQDKGWTMFVFWGTPLTVFQAEWTLHDANSATEGAQSSICKWFLHFALQHVGKDLSYATVRDRLNFELSSPNGDYRNQPFRAYDMTPGEISPGLVLVYHVKPDALTAAEKGQLLRNLIHSKKGFEEVSALSPQHLDLLMDFVAANPDFATMLALSSPSEGAFKDAKARYKSRQACPSDYVHPNKMQVLKQIRQGEIALAAFAREHPNDEITGVDDADQGIAARHALMTFVQNYRFTPFLLAHVGEPRIMAFYRQLTTAYANRADADSRETALVMMTTLLQQMRVWIEDLRYAPPEVRALEGGARRMFASLEDTDDARFWRLVRKFATRGGRTEARAAEVLDRALNPAVPFSTLVRYGRPREGERDEWRALAEEEATRGRGEQQHQREPSTKEEETRRLFRNRSGAGIVAAREQLNASRVARRQQERHRQRRRADNDVYYD